MASSLRPAGRPSEKEAASLIQRLIHSLRRHWPNTEFLLRADGHYSTPEAMDLCDSLGVDYVFGLPTNSRVRKHVETRDVEKLATMPHQEANRRLSLTPPSGYSNFFSSSNDGKATSDDLHRKDWDGSSPQAGPAAAPPHPSALLKEGSTLNAD